MQEVSAQVLLHQGRRLLEQQASLVEEGSPVKEGSPLKNCVQACCVMLFFEAFSAGML